MTEFITAGQLVLHGFGDYVVQSDYMANEKTRKSSACLAHALTYAVPFLLVTQSPAALAVIASTHFVIDRWRLARYVCWVKNFVQPKFEWARKCDCGPDEKCGAACGTARAKVSMVRNYPWSECSATGYHKDRPAWMSVWLMIITDNIMHVVCNGLAISFL